MMASWQFKNKKELFDEKAFFCSSNCELGGDDAFGFHFSRRVNSVHSYFVQTWGSGGDIDKGSAFKVDTERMRPADANVTGVIFRGQDVLDVAIGKTDTGGLLSKSYNDFNFYNGLLIYEIKNPGCGPLQAFSKYGHNWASTSINSLGVGIDSVSISWTEDSNGWELGSDPSNEVNPC